MADIWRTGADSCGQLRTTLVLGCLFQLADIWWTSGGRLRTRADRWGQLWILDVSPIWRTFGGQVRTGADNSGSWVSLLVGGRLADRCGQVRTSLVTGYLVVGGHLVDNWRTGADKCGQPDIWRTLVSLLDLTPTFGWNFTCYGFL